MIGPLLAKSSDRPENPPEWATLTGHLRAAHVAARTILEVTAETQLDALGIPREALERYRRIVLLAAAVHDLGKANDHFQSRVRGDRPLDRPQGLRHEWVTDWILSRPAWGDWFSGALDLPHDLRLVRWAVCGHHRQPVPREAREGAGVSLVVFLGHEDVRSLLEWLAREFGMRTPPPRSTDARLKLAGGHGTIFTELARDVARGRSKWRGLSPEDQRLVACVKACLLASDVAASALAAKSVEIRAWIRNALTPSPDGVDLASIVRYRVQGKPLRPFQEHAAADEPGIPLIQAGCGSGKTVAAWHWAATRHPDRRTLKSSVMPQGVEHTLTQAINEGIEIVRNSVMPKGVEHLGNGRPSFPRRAVQASRV